MKKRKKPKKIQKAKRYNFNENFEQFFKYLNNIRILVIFITLFIALYAILQGLPIDENNDLPAYVSLHSIRFFLYGAFFMIGLYWFIGNNRKYLENIFIISFLGIFGVCLFSSSLWILSLYETLDIPLLIQYIYVFWPVILALFLIFNIMRKHI
jgi:hypothetical protein